jgi:WD40 repeat protein
MAQTPDGRILVSAGEDDTIRLWSLPSGKYLRTLSGHAGTVRSLAISPDGEVLASGSEDGTIRIWSLPEGRSMFSFAAHSGGVFTVAVAADGRVMSSGGADQTVRLWSMPDGRLLATLTGHSAPVRQVVFKGQILISGSGDGMIREWSVPGQAAHGNPVSTGDSLTFLMITPDGGFIFTSGTDSSGKASLKWWQALDVIAFLLCLIDLAANVASVSGRQFDLNGTVYTLPCGSPMPAGATCKCDCVPGSISTCPANAPGCTCDPNGCPSTGVCTCNPNGCPSNQVCTCNEVCTCNQVCTCVPVSKPK